jgi:D-alanine--poly(phosphoribitol) ligase subunit 2
MDTNEIAARLRSYIRQKFGIPDSDPQFSDDVDLFNYGYIDSFGAVDLHAFIEDAFSVRPTSSELIAVPLNTISQIAEFLARRQTGES